MATSALDYEDAKTAIDFLRKALNILEKWLSYLKIVISANKLI
jgi:hypothetical protein